MRKFLRQKNGRVIAVAFASRPASQTRHSASLEHGGFMDVQFYTAYCTKLTVGQNSCDMKSKVGKKGEKVNCKL